MIWLIGSKGMLGSEVAKQLTENKLNWIGTDIEVDITDYQALENYINTIEKESYFPNSMPLSERQIKWIINCAAYTNVEKAEEESELAQKTNELGPKNIARIARNHGAKLIHISTDYVFGGNATNPYKEDDEKNPLGVYGRTKLGGEIEIQKQMNTYYIIRTEWLYGFDGNNFVYTMTKLMNSKESIKVISDQKGTPTYVPDLAEVIIKILEKNQCAKSFFGKHSAPPYGIYHFTNEGETNWYEFAQAIYSFGKKHGKITANCQILPCTTEEYDTSVERPAYSVLCKDKIQKELKIKIPNWRISLEKFIKSDRFNER